jgi:ribosomal protein L11 methyltransferase
MPYVAFRFIVQPRDPGTDILCACLAEMGFESFAEEENGFTAFIRKELESSADPAGLKFDDFSFTFTRELIADKNWNEEWEKHFEPVAIDDRLFVRASFHDPRPGFAHEIVITPKMSFGTGHHRTTRLMCRAMLEMDFKGRRVLDMGCGTGILAILAAKLGARDIVGVDIDEWPVENAKENAEMNNASFIRIYQGDADALNGEKPFDVILANINRNVLLDHIPVYSGFMRPGGVLLLSGFFPSDVPDLRRLADSCGLGFTGTNSESEWAMLSFLKS